MDQIKIGKFIQELRKEKGYTQKELADRVGISDKTISKWETGNGMPDIGMLTALCKELEINVNELLSGESLPPSEYSKKAEDNIMSLLKENQRSKENGFIQAIIGILLLILGSVWIFLGNGASPAWYIDLPSILAEIIVCTSIVFLSGSKNKMEILAILRKTVIPVGIIVALASTVAMLGNLSSPEKIGPMFAVSILGPMYAMAAYLVIAVAESKLN